MSRQTTLAARPAPVLSDLLPGDWARDLILAGAYALAIGISAQLSIKLPFTPVPITGQTFAVLAGALLLGTRRALLGSVIYLVLGSAGIPWFATASGVTLGYVFGFIVAAIVVGFFAERGFDRSPLTSVPVLVLGNLLIYLVGVLYLKNAIDVSLAKALDLGVYPFLLGDAIKIALAAALVPALWKATNHNT
ncbi:MAG: biotin transport system substrate-specific component [Actinomycetota bacterium]|nr:biotin transport system substrate-specific component [Actinomycetota bacterium]